MIDKYFPLGQETMRTLAIVVVTILVYELTEYNGFWVNADGDVSQ